MLTLTEHPGMVESREKDKEAVVRPWAQVMERTTHHLRWLYEAEWGKKQR